VINDNDDAVMFNHHQVMIDWSFRWFRHITPLSHKHQRQIVDKIIGNKGKVSTKQIQDCRMLLDEAACLRLLSSHDIYVSVPSLLLTASGR
jgi:hypothetical protein